MQSSLAGGGRKDDAGDGKQVLFDDDAPVLLQAGQVAVAHAVVALAGLIFCTENRDGCLATHVRVTPWTFG